MAEKIIEKRKFVWKITNFTRDAVNKYEKGKSVISEKFVILLGDFGENMTEWSLWLNPKSEGAYCGFFIQKESVDRDDFRFKLRLAIQKSDGSTADHFTTEQPSNVFSIGQSWGWPKYLPVETFFRAGNKYLANNVLTLIIRLDLHQDGPPMKKPRLDLALPGWMAKYFNSEELSDITFVCSDEKSIPAHRFVLISRSSVFKTMFATDMAEKKSSKITLADINSDSMLEFLRYIYKHEVQDLKKHAPKLLDYAEKYYITDLKQICVQSLVEHLSDKNVFENMLLAKLYNERKLMHKCVDYINTNFRKLKESGEWKMLDNDLMVKIMNYMQERFNGIELTNSLLK